MDTQPSAGRLVIAALASATASFLLVVAIRMLDDESDLRTRAVAWWRAHITEPPKRRAEILQAQREVVFEAMSCVEPMEPSQ